MRLIQDRGADYNSSLHAATDPDLYIDKGKL